VDKMKPPINNEQNHPDEFVGMNGLGGIKLDHRPFP